MDKSIVIQITPQDISEALTRHGFLVNDYTTKTVSETLVGSTKYDPNSILDDIIENETLDLLYG